MDKKDTVVMYRSAMEAILSLTSMKDVKTILSAVVDFGMNGNEDPEIPEHLLFGWLQIKAQISAMNDRFAEISAKRSEAGRLGYASKCKQMQAKQANAVFAEQTQANASKCKQMQAKQANAVFAEQTQANASYMEMEMENDINNIPVGDIKNTRTRTRGKYPESVQEILDIAEQPTCGVKITEKQARVYLLNRTSVDWVDAAGRTIKPERVSADLQKWMLREEQSEKDKVKANNGSETPVYGQNQRGRR